MGIIVEFSVSPKDFKLGGMLCLDTNTKVRVEQLVPMGDKVMPFSWVSGDLGSFEENIENEMGYEVVLDDEENDRRLYRLEWDVEHDDLIQAIIEFDGAVLDAEGTHRNWDFRIRFREREKLSEFKRYCDENGVHIKIKRIYNPIEVSGDSRTGMTSVQAKTLVDALESGYFDIPRKTSLVKLSESYGVSDQAVSERIRRATAELIRSSLMVDEELTALEEA